MVRRVRLDETTDLGLPGRRSREIVSGKTGASSTLRLVEIAVPSPDAPQRPPHWHPDSEEVIHVLEGQATTWVDGEAFAMAAGDTIHIAIGEKHVTRNIGATPLKLLCFFPNPAFTMLTAESVSGHE